MKEAQRLNMLPLSFTARFRRQAFRVAAILVLSSTVWSQEASFEISKSFVNSHDEFTIKNNSKSAITAFVAAVGPSGDDSALKYYDALRPQGGDKLIPPGASMTFQGTPRMHGVIFEDGTTVGEDPWVQELLGMRRAMYTSWRAVLDFLDANKTAATPDQLLVAFKKQRPPRSVMFPDRVAAQSDQAWSGAETLISIVVGQSSKDQGFNEHFGHTLSIWRARFERELADLRGSKPNFDNAHPPKDLPLDLSSLTVK